MNFKNLIKEIDYYEKNFLEVWTINPKTRNREKWEPFTKEFLRVLYNYLMAVYSLYDRHKSWRDHLDKRFNDIMTNSGYFENIHELKLINQYNYLKKLRHKFTHKTIDSLGIKHIEFSLVETEDKEEKGIISFIDFKNEGKVVNEIKDITKNYQYSITEFHNWLTRIIIQKFSDEIIKTKNLLQKAVEMENRL